MGPCDFIPILDDAKITYKLDLYVTDQILKRMKEQANKGLYIVPISVNLSRSDFDTCDIVEEIKTQGLWGKLSAHPAEFVVTKSLKAVKKPPDLDATLILAFKC